MGLDSSPWIRFTTIWEIFCFFCPSILCKSKIRTYDNPVHLNQSDESLFPLRIQVCPQKRIIYTYIPIVRMGLEHFGTLKSYSRNGPVWILRLHVSWRSIVAFDHYSQKQIIVCHRLGSQREDSIKTWEVFGG